jgi:hypothetical protein
MAQRPIWRLRIPAAFTDYRALACKDDVAEKAKLSVLEDTYAPSSRQRQGRSSRSRTSRVGRLYCAEILRLRGLN